MHCILVIVGFLLSEHKRSFPIFFSSQKAPISKTNAHFYHIGEPISIDVNLSGGELLL